MTMTQFAMVEELASLIRDNLYCKHLVLSVEEALVNFIHNDTSQKGLIELQPVGPYYRLLLHRLADIYGFAHESVGEGDDRHLVLERSSETAIPPILISDILWQYDGCESPTPSHNILRRTEVPEIQKSDTLRTSMSLEEKEATYQAARERIFSMQDNAEKEFLEIQKNNTSRTSMSLEEKEAAYQAARERIFSMQDNAEKELVTPKSRCVPVIAQRMIAHALGTKINSNKETPGTDKMIKTNAPTNTEHSKQSSQEKKMHQKHTGKSNKVNAKTIGLNSEKISPVPKPRSLKVGDVVNMEREQKGAAKRIFANALGLKPGKSNQDST